MNSEALQQMQRKCFKHGDKSQLETLRKNGISLRLADAKGQ
uniref:Uncharacterized protein n=1 Tax=Methylophaga nitratireducenticrescens TaxID=754476 RepID=I1XJS9_METNJ